jgi:acetyltransferase-like isoleucine patch superfamily enzyme
LLNRMVSSYTKLPRYVLSRLMSDGAWAVSPYTRLYSFVLCKLRKDVELVGKSRLYIHPSTRLHMRGSKIIIDNGTLRIGITHLYGPSEYDATKDNCRVSLHDSVIHINGDVSFFPGSKIVAYGGRLVVGSGTLIFAPNYIRVRKRVEIGQRCITGPCLTIMDSDVHKVAIGNDEPKLQTKEVIIKDNCWIGQNATILKGVTVGEGAIVGANAVVTRDVQPRTMVAGNPARVIKDNVAWQF